MKKMPKFHRENPSNIEEKLIIEILNDLEATFKASIKLNCNSPDLNQEQLFKVLRDSVLSFSSSVLEYLVRLLANKKDIKPFLAECHDIFCNYLKQTEDMNK